MNKCMNHKSYLKAWNGKVPDLKNVPVLCPKQELSAEQSELKARERQKECAAGAEQPRDAYVAVMLLVCEQSFGLPVSQSFVLVNKFLIINNILSTKLLTFPMLYFPSWGGDFFYNSFLCWKCKLSEFISCSCSFSADFTNV